MKAPILHSERLKLAPLTSKYCTIEYVNWLNDPDVYRYLEVGGDYNIDMLKKYLNEVELKDIYFWAIHLKDSGKHIGNIKIDPISSRHGVGEYGILLGCRSAWGTGFAKEASSMVIDYCFNVLNLRKITLGVVANNKPAVKLYESLGFTCEGILVAQGIWGGEVCDSYRMAVFNPKLSKSS